MSSSPEGEAGAEPGDRARAPARVGPGTAVVISVLMGWLSVLAGSASHFLAILLYVA